MPLEAADELPGTKKDRECLRGLEFYAQGTPDNAVVYYAYVTSVSRVGDWNRRLINTMAQVLP
jgi:hypothetical protein